MLKEKLKHIIPFDSETLTVLSNLFLEEQVSKGKVFAQKGEYSKMIAFVKSGVLRAYYSNDKGEEYNKTFFTETSFVGAYSSLVTGERNLINIDCLTPCTLLIAEYQKIVGLTSSLKTEPS
ncbi:MAG: cyclic nucleotide-binding domain-containing protein [Bacteroidetes bacterium]|nr:cyclic nucleotide-binding domain-containing protein [Bacteroidota bacterium]MDA1127034.1 cyclic nucleotide-binding domain-containing protein [Bacteroidota bacterium]